MVVGDGTQDLVDARGFHVEFRQASYCYKQGSAPKYLERIIRVGREPQTNSTKHMLHTVRRKIVLILAAGGGFLLPALNTSESTAGWESSVHDAEVGRTSLEAGIDAYKDGALEISIKALSNALDGSLTNKQQGEALYFRGLAYRELGLPGQAILDLTRAISLKNGLSRAHLKDAVRNRVGAMREAGLAASQPVVADDTSRTAVPILPDRVPVPEERARPSAALTTGSIGTGQQPPTPNGGFVSAVEKLVMPDWP